MLLVSDMPSGMMSARLRLGTNLRRIPRMPQEEQRRALASGTLGTDVPLKKGAASTGASSLPFSATCTLTWPPALPGCAPAPTHAPGGVLGEGDGCGAAVRSDMQVLGEYAVALCWHVARACDAAVGLERDAGLAAALALSCSAKARALYYSPGETVEGEEKGRTLAEGFPGSSAAWQAWHCDYGLLTALSPPLYLGEEGGEVAAPSGAGLHVLPPRSTSPPSPHRMDIPHGCMGVQLGEAASLLAGGALTARAHTVLRPTGAGGASKGRGQFVLFCQPAWGAALTPLTLQHGGGAAACDEGTAALGALLPPLASRAPPGVKTTFADFSKVTTAAYYSRRAV
jgi:hypothetical protein